MRPARPASSPVLRGRRVSPDTLMLRQPETAGPGQAPRAAETRHFPDGPCSLFLCWTFSWRSGKPCTGSTGLLSFRVAAFLSGVAQTRGHGPGGTAECTTPALGSPGVCATPGARSPSDATGSGYAACRAPESPSPCPGGHTGPSVLWLGGRGHRPSVAECAARWRQLRAHGWTRVCQPPPPPVWRVRTGREVEPRGGVGVLTGAAESSPTGDRGCAVSQPALSRHQARALLPDGEKRAPLSAVTTQSADHGQVLNVQ